MLSQDYSLERVGGGLLTGRPWPWWSPGRKGGGFVMAALTRTSLTIFSRLVSDCQAEREPSLHNSSDLVSFTAASRAAPLLKEMQRWSSSQHANVIVQSNNSEAT